MGRKIETVVGYVFIFPALIMVILFLIFPMANNVYLSFFDWDGLRDKVFIGLNNYFKFFTDEIFLRSVLNTLVWVVFTICFTVTGGLLIAVFVNNIKGENFFKTIFFLPLSISFVSTGAIWIYMYSKEYGVINELLRLIGFDSQIAWLFDRPLNTVSMMFASSWQTLGAQMVLFLMGLTSLHKEPLEAASIDGANKWQTFIHMIFPALKPITTVVVGLAIVNSFKTFDIIFVMTKGGPIRSSETLAVTMYIETFQRTNMGYGASIAVLLSLIILPVSIVYIKSMIHTDSIDYK